MILFSAWHCIFSPNAGSMPPELVGRDGILEDARILLARTQLRRSAQSLLMTGLRGVGKTVILNEIVRLAEREGLAVPNLYGGDGGKTFGGDAGHSPMPTYAWKKMPLRGFAKKREDIRISFRNGAVSSGTSSSANRLRRLHEPWMWRKAQLPNAGHR